MIAVNDFGPAAVLLAYGFVVALIILAGSIASKSRK